MSTLDQIKLPVAREFDRYENYLTTSLHHENELINAMLAYILGSRGKGIRPLLVLLSSSLNAAVADSPLPERTHLAAMLIEMMHTASLVHDDVIDEADLRRGKPSVNAIWDSHRSVLIGDYILATIFSHGMRSGENDIVTYISGSMSELCEGELIQSDQSDKLTMTREIYNIIIYKKTATLLGTSCGAGAMAVGADAATISRMKELGDNLGMAFQIKDDILDYTSVENTGKPEWGDLREQKINLPLLMVMEQACEADRSSIRRLLSEARDNTDSLAALYSMVADGGGIEMAAREMDGYIDKALDILMTYPQSPYRNSLIQLCSFISTRDR